MNLNKYRISTLLEKERVTTVVQLTLVVLLFTLLISGCQNLSYGWKPKEGGTVRVELKF